MAEERRSVKDIGKGASRIVMRVLCIDIFGSKILKENSNHISFEFSIGGAVYQSRLIEPCQLVGEELHIKFSKSRLMESEILVAVQQYRGIHNHNLGYLQIGNQELLGAEKQTCSKFIYKNKEEPVGFMEYEISVEM